MAADVREVIGLIPPQHKPQLGHRNGTLRLLTYFHKADSPVSVDRQITMQDIPDLTEVPFSYYHKNYCQTIFS